MDDNQKFNDFIAMLYAPQPPNKFSTKELLKGDVEGHAFHGNQWTGGIPEGWSSVSVHDYAVSQLAGMKDTVARTSKGMPPEYEAKFSEMLFNGKSEKEYINETEKMWSGSKIIKLDGNKTVLINRPDSHLSDEQVKTVAERIALLNEAFPQAASLIVLGNKLGAVDDKGNFSGASTLWDRTTINGDVVGNGTMDSMTKGWSPDSSKGMSVLEYTTIHEFGHAIMFQKYAGDEFAKATSSLINENVSPSKYGTYSHEEAYAECFADYVCSGGKSPNGMTQTLANAEGWKEKLGY